MDKKAISFSWKKSGHEGKNHFLSCQPSDFAKKKKKPSYALWAAAKASQIIGSHCRLPFLCKVDFPGLLPRPNCCGVSLSYYVRRVDSEEVEMENGWMVDP